MGVGTNETRNAVATLTGQSDTPSSYTGAAGSLVVVNQTPDAVEFDPTFSIDASGNLEQSAGANGGLLGWSMWTELTTIAAAATTSTTFTIPDGALLMGVSCRVTVAIPDVTDFDIEFEAAAVVSSVSQAANSTGAETCAVTNDDGSTQALVIRPNTSPSGATGRVRVVAHYWEITAPTS